MSQVYAVKAKIQREGKKDYWLNIGTATMVKDGKIIMTLDALPLHSNGVMMLFPVEERGEDNGS